MERYCCECGYLPARMYLPDTARRLCGVCAHRLAIAQDLALRIVRARVKPSSEGRPLIKRVA